MIAALALALATAPVPCPAEPPLSYVCGAEKPEDIVRIGRSDWLVASGFAQGAGLKLIDARTAEASLWYRGTRDQIAWDRKRFAACPGPVDPALFNARGLSVREQADGTHRLLVVNHGGRESIELFDIDLRPSRPALRWRGCLPLPPGHVANSVASFADGTILTTILTRPGTGITDFVRGGITGLVMAWRPGDTGFAPLPGTELPGNNGLEVSPDGRHYYVVAFGWHAVLKFDRTRQDGPVARLTMPDFMPDNIHWIDGRLVAAGMRLDEPACGGLRRIVDGEADKMLCHRGYVVAAMDGDLTHVSTLAYGEPSPSFNGVSAAAFAGGRIWLGSYQADRLAWRADPAAGN